MKTILTIALVILFLTTAVILMSLPAGSAAGPAITTTPTPAHAAHLPFIRNDALPTPPPTPTLTPHSAAAALYVTPFGGILASTFNPSSFIVANESLGGERLTQLRIDLSTALFPDMVFDPFGAAGDTVAKNVSVDVREGLSFNGHTFEGDHDGGFDALVLNFANFDRGDRFEFSVDVDPTSITGVGAPGPMESGSVAGLELVGATITATFDDGSTLAGQLWRVPTNADPNHSGAVALLRPGLPERPALELVGVAAPAHVTGANQVARVGGPAGRPVVVLVVEGGLFTDGLPGGGFDLDPYEANSAVVAREYSGVIGPAGTAEIPIQLSHSLTGGGVNYVSAVFDNHYGIKGLVAPPLAVQLD
jgi:hypothetical protein